MGALPPLEIYFAHQKISDPLFFQITASMLPLLEIMLVTGLESLRTIFGSFLLVQELLESAQSPN